MGNGSFNFTTFLTFHFQPPVPTLVTLEMMADLRNLVDRIPDSSVRERRYRETKDLGSFQFGEVINDAAVSTLAHVCMCPYVHISFWCITWRWNRGISYSAEAFQSGCINLHFYQKTDSSGFPGSSSASGIARFFHFSHSGLMCCCIILACKFAFP